jgi:YihY family inner membrane protein
LSVALSSAQQRIMSVVFMGHTNNFAYTLLSRGFLSVLATVSSVTLFFLIYWILPNRKIPALAVLPTAVVTGLLWEGAKYLYVMTLPHLNFQDVYGPFRISVGLMLWAFLSGLMLLAGAHFSATRHALRMAAHVEREG